LVWAKGVIFGLKSIVGLKYREIGVENKLANPVIYASNHQSALEPILFGMLIPNVAIVLKESLYRIPIFGWYLRRSPMIAINRSAGTSAMRKILEGSKQAISEHRSILIFPEGTRQPIYANSEYHKGIALIYRELNRPVVPVAVNSGVFWINGAAMKYSGEVTVSYLNPIQPGLPANEFLEILRGRINAEKERLIRELDIDLWIAALS
jgi:1-acyl-sn-glycerol-3-phosphate acyltransferase